MFEIEHHAVLFGLLAQHSAAKSDAEGLLANEMGVARYGEERGARMARNASRDGNPPTMENFLCYGEWTAKPGQMEAQETALSPEYQVAVRRCEWNESWKRHGLERFGSHYCRFIDHHLVKGFAPELAVDVATFLSEGAPACSFTWHGLAFDQADLATFAAKRRAAAAAHGRDFRFHTRHLYRTMTEVLREQLGTAAEQIILAAMADFETRFGAAARAAVTADDETVTAADER